MIRSNDESILGDFGLLEYKISIFEIVTPGSLAEFYMNSAQKKVL